MSEDQSTSSSLTNREEQQKAKQAARAKAWHEANKERNAVRMKAWREANKEKTQAIGKAYREANKTKLRVTKKAYQDANKESISSYSKVYREAHKDEIAARKKAHYEANRERLIAKSRAYVEANKEATAARLSAGHRRSKYGVSPDEFAKMLEQCRGRCPCCKVPFSAMLREKPCIDHCHKRGLGQRQAVRGIVCHRCNLIFGHAGDDPTILRACARHLEKNRVT